MLKAVPAKGVRAEVIGEINADVREVFEQKGRSVAVIPNRPSQADMEELEKA